jgi:DNA-binding transcriptional ArsR family regulator
LDDETILASGGRRKILKLLAKEKHANIMRLVVKTNSTYIEANRNIKSLKEEGVVKEEYYGRVRMIILLEDNPKTKRLLQALKILNDQTKPRDWLF